MRKEGQREAVMVGEDHGNLENWQFLPSFVGSFKGQEFEDAKDNPDSDSLIRFFATTCATIVLARSLAHSGMARLTDSPILLPLLSTFLVPPPPSLSGSAPPAAASGSDMLHAETV